MTLQATNVPLQRSEYLSFPSVMLFLLPLLTVPRVNVVGVLMLADLVVLALLPILLFSGRFYVRQPYLPLILSMLAVWFIGAMVADFVAESTMRDLLRGWAKLFFFGVALAVVFILVNMRHERVFMLLLGYGLMLPARGFLGSDFYQSTGPFFSTVPWKFGNGLGLTLLVCLATHHWMRHVQGPAIAGFSLVHLALNARSLFLLTFLTGALSSISMRIARSQNRLVVGLLLLVLAVGGASVGMSVYGQLAESGVLGDTQRDKYLAQTAGGVNILLGGRSESIVSLQAVKDSLLFGHGSWAQSIEYRLQYFAAQEALGRDVRWSALYNTLRIPSHSHLLGAWVEHGILGALFWFMVLGLVIKALYEGVLGLYQAMPVEIFIFINTFWTVLFSPFGLASRVTMAINLVVICHFLYRAWRTRMGFSDEAQP